MNRILFFFAALLTLSPLAYAATPLDYGRDIRPILSENCFHCHGFDEKARKAKLRLDVMESAYAERGGVIALKPGDLAKSDVWRRINTDDAEEAMPPPKDHAKLSDADKAKIKTWIEQGAKYSAHWAFIPPQRPTVPPLATGSVNAIDALVRQRLKDAGLTPSAEADKHTLIRRVTLDLTGLPPTADDVAKFVKDTDPHAYEALVDRLLNSPHFGERLALDWLDAARYADTNGFSIDGGRHMWIWRDWVIQAFNDNKPYDKFLTEQLAGDLLPKHSDSQLIATGFQRNNMVTHEGGTIPDENLTNYNADRVKTLCESVLGLTLGCAQCHDHKFDPITQKDYYQVFAFFNSLSDKGLDGDGGVNPRPFIETTTVIKTGEAPALQTQIAALTEKLAKSDPALLAAWEQRERAKLDARGKNLKLHPVQVIKVSTPNRGTGFEKEGESGVRVKNILGVVAFDISAKMPQVNEPVTGLRYVFRPDPELPGDGWGSGPTGKAIKDKPGSDKPKKGTFVLTAIAATADKVPSDQVNLHKLEGISATTASSWDMRYPPGDCLKADDHAGWSPDLAATGPVHLTATFAKPLNATETPFLTTQLFFAQGKGLVPEHIDVFAMTGRDDGSDLPPAIITLLETPAAARTEAQQSALWQACAVHSDDLQRTRVDLANAKERLAALTQKFPTMVMDSAAKPRDTFILNRGDYSKPTIKVSAGTLSALPAMPEGSSADRLGLAHWLTMKSHPLTARVAVNRFWKLLFGTGIVATAADFGAQGEYPTHPDVLDWLAVEFMENGWDTKQLIKRIVMSATYRQSSAASREALERDPQNRLLARGPRFRLPAEILRDAALSTSGLLVPRVGGPSVNPYTPGNLWREVSHYGSTPATAQTFVQDHGEKLYRRSLYTYWKRTAAPPNMAAFDAPNREVCTIARGNTTTPLQALVTLNDPQFVEAARAFAQRILTHGGSDDAKLRWAILEATSRELKPSELPILQSALRRERQRYTARLNDPEAALSVGESLRDSSIPAPEHAAWMQIAALILNLSETVTRN